MKENNKKSKKKNLIIAGIFIISVIIILFGGALLYNKFFYKKSYSEVESIMLDAAKNHFKENSDKLPQNINDSITITLDSLVKNNKMNTVASYTKDKNVSCEGEVKVTNINGNYRYTPILICDNKHRTQTLTDYIDENVDIVTDGNGLYNLNNELVYRGDDVNNYIKINTRTYRIVKIKDGHPVIILNGDSEAIQWDNRYNIENDSVEGINDFYMSNINNYLNKLYKATSEKIKLLITRQDLPIGKRNNEDTDKSGKLENATTLPNQYVGLLPLNDFLNASLDKNCTTSVSKSCANYNYLNNYSDIWWTMTGNSTYSYRVYAVEDIAGSITTSRTAYVRPVLYLATDTIYVSGDGSKANPYIIK